MWFGRTMPRPQGKQPLPPPSVQRPPAVGRASRAAPPHLATLSALDDRLISIPAGPFPMGDADDQHDVVTDSFLIDTYPVTNADYRPFVDACPRFAPTHWQPEYPEPLHDHPVVNVTWYDAVAYCRWLTDTWRQRGLLAADSVVRLPTEAEWEKAARGTDGRRYPWGDTFDAHRCNCCETRIGWSTPVTAFPEGAGPYGLMDTIGNVWEWCSTLFADYPYRADDGRETPSGDDWRVLRGGSWLDHEWGVRCGRRLSGDPTQATHNAGFRICVAEGDATGADVSPERKSSTFNL